MSHFVTAILEKEEDNYTVATASGLCFAEAEKTGAF